MKMNIDLAEQIQDRLQIMVAGSNDLTPSYFKGGVTSGGSEIQCWQEGVDTIYRLLKSGILFILPKAAIKTEEDMLDFGRALAEQNPFTITGEAFVRDWGCPWMDPLLCASDLCKQLMQKYGIANYDASLCEAFIEELEALFDVADVTWSTEPLIPIQLSKPS